MFTPTQEVYIVSSSKTQLASLIASDTMFICGQMYSPYVQLWKLLESYRTNLKVTPVIRSEEVLETSLKGFP